MGIINTGSFGKALWPGINKWFGEAFKEWPTEYTDLFDRESSNKAYEEEVGTVGFGLAQEKTQGGPVAYDEAKQGYIQRYVNVAYALGFIITREMMEDNQYNIATIGKKQSQGLKFSMNQTWEILGANVYNRAFATYTFADGKTLCASDHPLFGGGSFSNIPSVAADLSEAALEQACIDIAGFVNERGLKISILPKSLHISKENMFEATRILQSVLQNDTANNAINAIKSMGIFPGGAKVNHYFTDADAWFIRTNCPDGMKYFERTPLEFRMDNDFDTDNAKYKAYRRGSFGNTDPRGIYGSAGA